MIIGIDGTSLLGDRKGVGWYLTHLLEALSHILEEDKLYVWLNSPSPEERARVSENRFVAVSATHYPWAALRLTWNTLGTPALESLIGRPADLYFYPTGMPIPQKHGKKVLFLHELTCLTQPEMADPEEFQTFVPELQKQIAKADLVLTCSEYNRRELIKHFSGLTEAKVRVVPYGVPESFLKPASTAQVQNLRSQYGLNKPYFLFTGRLEPRKNLLRLVHSFLLFTQRVKTDHQLVLAGPRGWIGEDFIQFILAPQVVERVRWIDSVASPDLPALYSGADAFFLPSVRESFGLPALEAMGCGTPVICSNTGALSEVVGDAAWLVDPTKVPDWSLAMQRIVTEPEFGRLLREKGRTRVGLFKMENSAKQTLAAFRLAVQTHG
ncbi:MAG TPA: glycosyltransferase family 1 protein [bacterium]|nr:glycosyltransferase family 1 protein [bacterium]